MTASQRPPKALYQLDERLRSYVNASESSHIVETAETIFYAQGGGQPSDTGCITKKLRSDQKSVRFDVEAVRHGKQGRILHLVTGEDIADSLHPGDLVEQRVDGIRRDLNSRAHTAGHIVGLAVRKLVEQTPELSVSELKASHFPDACFVEFKGLIDGKHKAAIQEQVSKYVKDALPIELSWYPPGDFGTHSVATTEGAYPCGGARVPDTSYVRELVIKGIKRQKGISKVSHAIADTV
ncbi:hypothetical protein K431DRAFT_304343 [Polychaeton citri CBS 116435]|uniref:Alanyl-transfer RNA synthetases family profile domain-containing protein n=1 Tax=Polychaeton citri CBS 116435 TaxID=1314669 RepID=A0A9P4Q6S3_9PEZI|nr:hypothetical protein K431DRAFT_304343 [Polychaeton citri CBS 116435]